MKNLWHKFKHWLIRKLGGVPKSAFESLECELKETLEELLEKEKEILRLKQNNTNSPMSKRRVIDIATYCVEPISLQTVYRMPLELRYYNSEAFEEKIVQDCVRELCETIIADKLYNLRWSENDPISLNKECLIELKIYPPYREESRQ